MKAFIQAFVLALILLIPFTASRALPVLNTGGTRCQCACRGNGDFKDLDWVKTQSCSSSNGKSCTFTNNGKTKSGTLGDCQECRAGDTTTEWRCSTQAISRTPDGSLQRTPAQQKLPAKQPPPKAATRH